MKFITILVMVIAASVTVQSKSLETFIVNGTSSSTIEYFAHLEIFRQDDFGGPTMYFGGGTLISYSFVLTCAQNVVGFKSWRVGLGANRISNMQWFFSTTAFFHHGYDETTLVDNIALLRLTQLIPSGIGIFPTSLPSFIDPYPDETDKVTVYGFRFGTTNHQPDVLQQTTLNVLTQNECEARYPHLGETGHTQNHLCAEQTGVERNICAGDQGGPVLYMTNIKILVGIQSFYRYEDCRSVEAKPAGFLRIDKYIGWINNITINQPL